MIACACRIGVVKQSRTILPRCKILDNKAIKGKEKTPSNSKRTMPSTKGLVKAY